MEFSRTPKHAVPVTTQPDDIPVAPGEEVTAKIAVVRGDRTIPASERRPSPAKRITSFWMPWYRALKNILPIYLAVHLAFFFITCFAVLFILKDFSSENLNIDRWLHSWSHWDTNQYDAIALHGYEHWWKTVFFPFYPLLQRCLMLVTRDPLFAGLIISNIAGLAMLTVLYRLVEEDFDAEHAYRTVFYLSVFPTAFFLAAAYTESLFLFLALLSFYNMRRGHWWTAGLLGLLASLTRQAGLFLLIPFYCEYLRQRGDFKDVWLSTGNGIERLVRSLLQLDLFAGGLIVAGLGIFVAYCYLRFHILFPFSKAEGLYWNRDLHDPTWGIIRTLEVIAHSPGFLSFSALRNILDVGQVLFIGVLIVLSIAGPWRFSVGAGSARVGGIGAGTARVGSARVESARAEASSAPTGSRQGGGKLRPYWTYAVYGVALYVGLQLYPVRDFSFPLQSFPRYMLEIFPAFIVLARIDKSSRINLIYVIASGSLLFLLLTQYVTGHWIT